MNEVMQPPFPEVQPDRVRQDCRVLRRTLFRLGLPHFLRRLAVTVIGIVVYLLVARFILSYGANVSYAGLGGPDSAAVSFLTRINTYIWWALVVVLGLIVFFSLKSAWTNSVLRERGVPVPAADIRALADTLSVPVLDVMRWVWADHSDPFSLGDLQRTLAEVRSGRIQKTGLAIEQQAVLGTQRPI